MRHLFALLALVFCVGLFAQPVNDRAFRPGPAGTYKGTNAAGDVDDVVPAVKIAGLSSYQANDLVNVDGVLYKNVSGGVLTTQPPGTGWEPPFSADSSAWRTPTDTKSNSITGEIYRTGGVGLGMLPLSGHSISILGNGYMAGNFTLIGAAGESLTIGDQAGNSSRTVSIGPKANKSNTNNFGVFIGRNAGQFGSGNFSTVIGADAGKNSGTNVTFIGYSAGSLSTSVNGTYIGALAGTNANGSSSVLIGNLAGSSFNGANSIGIGRKSLLGSNVDNAVGLGVNNGLSSSGNYYTSIGAYSGGLSEKDYATIIGGGAVSTVSNTESTTAIGYSTGNYANGTGNTFIGASSNMDAIPKSTYTFLGSDYNASTYLLTNAAGLISQSETSTGESFSVLLPGANQYGGVNSVTIIDSNTVKFKEELLSQSFPDTFEISTYEKIDNSTAIGNTALTKLSNQVAIGNDLVNYITWAGRLYWAIPSIDEDLDGYVYQYNSLTDQMELKPFASSIESRATAGRSSTPTVPSLAFNTDLVCYEFYNGTNWITFGDDSYLQQSSNTVKFDRLYQYGNTASPRTGPLLFDFSGAQVGKVQVMVHNDASPPAFPAQARVRGTYLAGSDNIVELRYISNSLVLINIL